MTFNKWRGAGMVKERTSHSNSTEQPLAVSLSPELNRFGELSKEMRQKITLRAERTRIFETPVFSVAEAVKAFEACE